MDADEYTEEDNPFSYHLTIFAHIVWKVKQIKFYHRLISCTKYRIVKYGWEILRCNQQTGYKKIALSPFNFSGVTLRFLKNVTFYGILTEHKTISIQLCLPFTSQLTEVWIKYAKQCCHQKKVSKFRFGSRKVS